MTNKSRLYVYDGGFRVVHDCIRSCDEQVMVTFTSKRNYDPTALSGQVSRTLHRVNCALFGNAYRKRRLVCLATFAVQEQSINDGWHAHLLIGVPNGSRTIKAHPCQTPVADLILQTWIKGDDRGKRSANGQDARAVWDFDGALGYVSKTINTIRDAEQIDVLNTTVPTEAWLSETKSSR